MKTMFKFAIGTLILCSAFAAQAETADPSLKCVNKAVQQATLKNFKTYGASSNSCGVKLLHKGEFKETLIVCMSDETEPSEYIMVMDPNKSCKVDFISTTNESSTPTFDSNDGLLKSISCSIDNGEGKLSCTRQ
jgi:hypothetical protein